MRLDTHVIYKSPELLKHDLHLTCTAPESNI